MHAELQAIAREEGWSDELTRRVNALLARSQAAAPPGSILETMDEWGPAVSLEPEPQEQVTEDLVAQRYIDLGLLGEGGMGEVRRVRDRDLNRTMAMKIIRASAMVRPASLARFVEEAQATAQLQHPGIVPVHELGRLPDGRMYFTMKEVRGRTLGEVIAEVHAASSGRQWRASPSGWSFRRLVDAFHRVCEAVAYAHARGVVHRDLKPSNVMVGGLGEVLVVDWGLAKVVGRPDLAADAGDLDPVQTDRSLDRAHATQMGAVAGTPAYMPPEQARGEIDRIDARSDVYALGAMLYELLSGRCPYEGASARDVLQQVLVGPPEPPGGTATVPGELMEACLKAMARNPAERFPDALALAQEVAAWLEGARRREQALAVVDKAARNAPQAAALRAQAAALREEAAALLAPVKPWQPEQDKVAGWQKQDAAAALERQAELEALEEGQLLAASLTYAPELPEAHAALAALYRKEHAAAELGRVDGTRAEVLLKAHVAALPEDHPDRVGHVRYLHGDGALTLVTDPPGAEVLLHRYELHNRRLVPVFQRSLGRTPLSTVPLAMGSYLCLLRHPERCETRYPVHIGRNEHWDGVAPGEATPHPIWLPPSELLGAEDCYVPAGWFLSGGDREASCSLPRQRLWVDGFMMRRFPVTNRQYIAFLDDLAARGRMADALRHVPRERGGTSGEQGSQIYGLNGERFEIRPDVDGDVWDLDWAVAMVDWFDALAFASWEAAGAGRPWRLPGELEWEKAARGVDGRLYPWGDAYDPSWVCNMDSHPGRALPPVVDSFPVDTSPFGMRGAAGNMRDWCADTFDAQGPEVRDHRVQPVVLGEDTVRVRSYRGGNWSVTHLMARTAFRGRVAPENRSNTLSIRLARSVP